MCVWTVGGRLKTENFYSQLHLLIRCKEKNKSLKRLKLQQHMRYEEQLYCLTSRFQPVALQHFIFFRLALHGRTTLYCFQLLLCSVYLESCARHLYSVCTTFYLCETQSPWKNCIIPECYRLFQLQAETCG